MAEEPIDRLSDGLFRSSICLTLQSGTPTDTTNVQCIFALHDMRNDNHFLLCNNTLSSSKRLYTTTANSCNVVRIGPTARPDLLVRLSCTRLPDRNSPHPDVSSCDFAHQHPIHTHTTLVSIPDVNIFCRNGLQRFTRSDSRHPEQRIRNDWHCPSTSTSRKTLDRQR